MDENIKYAPLQSIYSDIAKQRLLKTSGEHMKPKINLVGKTKTMVFVDGGADTQKFVETIQEELKIYNPEEYCIVSRKP